MPTASFQHPLIKQKYLCIWFPLSHGSRRKGVSTSTPCFLLGNPKAFVSLVKLSCHTDSSRSHHMFLRKSPVLLHQLWSLPTPRFNHGPLLAQGNELFKQTKEWEFCKKQNLCGLRAFGIQLYYSLTVRSSCLFWVAMESSMVDNFSSSQSSGAASWGISVNQKQNITLKGIYLYRLSFHCCEAQNINASHKSHFDPLWPLAFFLSNITFFGGEYWRKKKKHTGVHTVTWKTIKHITWQPCKSLCQGLTNLLN